METNTWVKCPYCDEDNEDGYQVIDTETGEVTIYTDNGDVWVDTCHGTGKILKENSDAN